jgi:hypothetical protein
MTAPRRHLRFACAALLSAAAVWVAQGAGDALADAPGATAPTEAERLYAAGLEHLQAGRNAEALDALDASAKALPSPNTDLLRGHALRALGRRIEAMAAYESVVLVAGAKVRGGDSRFEPTLADAGTWVAFLRAELAELAIEIRTGGAEITLTVDGEAVPVAHDKTSGIARARLWREPGEDEVVARSSHGIERKETISLEASTSRAVSLDVTQAPEEPKGHAPPPYAWPFFALAGAGFTAAAVAGGLARSSFDELDRCKPRCRREQADEAELRATVTNVSLGIGAGALATGGVLWLVAELTESEPAPATSAQPKWGIAPVPAGGAAGVLHGVF